MKKTILISLMVAFVVGCSGLSQITQEEGYFEYVEGHTLNQSDAYDATLEWMAKNYGASKEVIQLQNKEAGKIIGKGIGEYWYDALQSLKVNYNYSLTITVRDNKTKFEFQTLSGETAVQKGDLYKVEQHYLDIKKSILIYYSSFGDDDF